MKSTICTVAAFLGAAALSFGYTTSTQNLIAGAPTELPVVDNTGTPIALGSGSVGVGYFGSFSDGAISGAADFGALLADFVQFGSQLSGFANGFGAPGFFDHSTDAPIPEGGNAFTNQPIFTVIGNAATLETSSQLAVWKGAVNFGAENAVGLGSANSAVTPGSGSLLFGGSGGPQDLGVAQFSDSIQLSGPIPEPSSALLLGLAGLGLLRRKR